ncbi:MAG: porin [Planctomycetaceae bacterium]|nr:porin [Planctomycetaceae bacterium]
MQSRKVPDGLGEAKMKRIWFGLLGTVAALALQFAQTAVSAGLFDECSPCGQVITCNPCGKQGNWFVNGFIESGFWANEFGTKNWYAPNDPTRHNDNMWPGNSPFLQNVAHTGYQANQMYISGGKTANGKRGWDFGGQVDFVFGSDVWMIQAAGFEFANGHDNLGWGTGDYYSAIPQAYFEAAYKNLNIYAGKFYLPLGAQRFRGDENFFYSFSSTWDFLPRTASGAYAAYDVGSQLSVVGGWVVPDQFGETSRNNAFLGGAIFHATDKLNLTYFTVTGEVDKKVSGAGADLGYFVNSLAATYDISKTWKAEFDWSMSNTQVDRSNYNYTAWGINAALYHQFSKDLSFGVRYNYVTGSDFANGGNYRYTAHGYYGNNLGRYPSSGLFSVKDSWKAISVGANWTPYKWLTVKPEVRWDIAEDENGDGWFWDSNGFSSENWHKQQVSGGVSTVVTF